MPTTTHNGAPASGNNRLMNNSNHAMGLSYPSPEKSVHRNASLNSALARMDDLGLQTAKHSLFRAMVSADTSKKNSHVPFERLEPERSIQTATEIVIAESPLNRAPTSVEDLGEQIRELQSLADPDHPSPHRKDLIGAARDACQTEFSPLERILSDRAASDPDQLDELLKKAMVFLGELEYPTPSKQPLLSLRNLQEGRRAIWSNALAIPDHKRPDLDQRILLESQAHVTAALRSLATAAVNDEHRRRVNEHRRFLARLSKETLSAVQTIDAVSRILDAAVTCSTHKRSPGNSDRVVLLGGPSVSAMHQLLVDSLHTTPEQLPVRLMARLVASMHDMAKSKHGIACPPQPGPLLSLLSPEEVLAAFHSLIDVHLTENNFYAEVRRYGCESFAKELYSKAKPRVHFARQSPALGLDFFEDSIATFPVPTGPEDQQTLSEIRRALPEVSIRLVHAQPNGCRLTRRLAGFPFCALAANAALHQSYAACSKYNHLPHVSGILPVVTDASRDVSATSGSSPNRNEE